MEDDARALGVQGRDRVGGFAVVGAVVNYSGGGGCDARGLVLAGAK